VKTYTHEELRGVLRLHALWLQGESNGIRANLRDANLTCANLTCANLTGADLTGANLTGADLTGANLTGADLTDANLTDANLRDANLRDANLTCADLTDANLTGANLTCADLTDANLTGADLTGAGVWIPKIEHIDARILREISTEGCRIEMATWHTCDTAHCRAGWAIQLAGAAGKAMEGLIGTGPAAALIYHMSRPGHPIPDWYVSNEDALADIKRHAALDPIPEVAK